MSSAQTWREKKYAGKRGALERVLNSTRRCQQQHRSVWLRDSQRCSHQEWQFASSGHRAGSVPAHRPVAPPDTRATSPWHGTGRRSVQPTLPWCVVILHVEPEKTTLFCLFSLLVKQNAATLPPSNVELLSLTHTGLSWPQWAPLVALHTWGWDASPCALMQPRNCGPFSFQISAIFGESPNNNNNNNKKGNYNYDYYFCFKWEKYFFHSPRTQTQQTRKT